MDNKLRLQELMTKYIFIIIRVVLGMFLFRFYWWLVLELIFNLQPITLVQSLVCVLGFRIFRRL